MRFVHLYIHLYIRLYIPLKYISYNTTMATTSLAMSSSFVFLLLCCLSSSCLAVDLIFMDNEQYLQKQQDGGVSQMDSQGFATALHALLSTAPSYAVSHKTSQQVVLRV